MVRNLEIVGSGTSVDACADISGNLDGLASRVAGVAHGFDGDGSRGVVVRHGDLRRIGLAPRLDSVGRLGRLAPIHLVVGAYRRRVRVAVGNRVVIENKIDSGGICRLLGRRVPAGQSHLVIVHRREIAVRSLPRDAHRVAFTLAVTSVGASGSLSGVPSTALESLDQPTSFLACTLNE